MFQRSTSQCVKLQLVKFSAFNNNIAYIYPTKEPYVITFAIQRQFSSTNMHIANK